MSGESSSWDGTEISDPSKEFQLQDCCTVPTPSGGMSSLLDIKKMVYILKSVRLSAWGILNFSFPSSSVWTVKWPLCRHVECRRRGKWPNSRVSRGEAIETRLFCSQKDMLQAIVTVLDHLCPYKYIDHPHMATFANMTESCRKYRWECVTYKQILTPQVRDLSSRSHLTSSSLGNHLHDWIKPLCWSWIFSSSWSSIVLISDNSRDIDAFFLGAFLIAFVVP